MQCAVIKISGYGFCQHSFIGYLCRMTRFLPHFTMATALLLLWVCASCRREADTERARADEALAAVVAQYEAEKTVNDSLLDIACRHFLPQKNTQDALLCKLFRGIHIYQRIYNTDKEVCADSLQMATQFFLEAHENADAIEDPTLLTILEYYSGAICWRNGLLDEYRSHCAHQLSYAKQTDNVTRVITAYQNYAHSFYITEQPDSAAKYIESALLLLPDMPESATDTLLLFMLHHDVILYRKSISNKLRNDYFGTSESYAKTLQDSCRLLLLRAEVFEEEDNYGEADSLIHWVLEHTDELRLRHRAYGLYARLKMKTGEAKASYEAMLKCLDLSRTFYIRQHADEIADTEKRYEMLLREKDFEFRLSCAIAIFLLILTVLSILLHIANNRRQKLQNEVVHYTALLHESQKELQASKIAIDNDHEEQQKLTKHYENTIQETVRHKSLLEQLVQTMLRRFMFLDESVFYNKGEFHELVRLYGMTSDERGQFIGLLDTAKLSDREKVICMILHEYPRSRKELMNLANITSAGACRIAIYRIRQSLLRLSGNHNDINILLDRLQADEP